MYKVRLFNKLIGEFTNVAFSSDLHLKHDLILKHRYFSTSDTMADTIYVNFYEHLEETDLLVLLGDHIMGENKNYEEVLETLGRTKENTIFLIGNHDNRNKMKEQLIYVFDYLEMKVDKTKLVLSHFPIFHWNYQNTGSLHLHGHTHNYESPTLKEMHTYKCMDVGLDSAFHLFNMYRPFYLDEVKEILKNNKICERH